MAHLVTLSIDVKKFKRTDLNKGQYLNITVAINDEENDYGQNVSAWLNQSKEEIEAQESRTYIGNGKAIWTDGSEVFVPGAKEKKKASPKKAAKPAAKKKAAEEEDDNDLPW